jgi:uncharacterized membrane protein (UPF0127 family)
MFNFSNKDLRFRKSQLPFLVLAFAPFFLHDLDLSGLFKVVKNVPNISPIGAQALIDGKAIKLEVADNLTKQASGLTHRADIDIDRGMLYQTSLSQPLIFTGEEMEFSTDLIFIMGDKVVGFYSDIKPCAATACLKYSLDRKYNRVLEVKAGIIETLGIKHGTQIDISFSIKK